MPPRLTPRSAPTLAPPPPPPPPPPPRRLRRAQVENLTSHYVFALGAYRGLYLLNWIYRYMTEDDYVQRIVWIAGVVQTGLYCDFFYHYYESKKGGMNKAVKLPV